MRDDNLPLEAVDNSPTERRRENRRHVLPRLCIGPLMHPGQWYRIGRCGIGTAYALQKGKAKYLPDMEGDWEFDSKEQTCVLYARFTPKRQKAKARK